MIGYMEDDVFFTLSRYESWFLTAVRSDYMRALSDGSLGVIEAQWLRHTGRAVRVCRSCGRSVLGFVKRVGEAWFSERDRRIREGLPLVRVVRTSKKR